MTRESCVVAVDVGNSAVKLCVRKASSDDPIDLSIAITDPQWPQQAIGWVRQQLGCQRTHWRVASVHRGAADALESAIDDESNEDDFSKVSRHDVPMQVRVEQPDKLGIDRLLGCYAAANRFGAPLVVVDAGSAVTIDWVDEETTFRGGAILPGLRLQSKALAVGTDALPQIDWMDKTPVSVPATNTVAAIRLGVLSSVAGAIDSLTASYLSHSSDETGKKPRLVMTGGDSSAISPYLRSEHQIAPNLVCRGLLDLREFGQ